MEPLSVPTSYHIDTTSAAPSAFPSEYPPSLLMSGAPCVIPISLPPVTCTMPSYVPYTVPSSLSTMTPLVELSEYTSSAPSSTPSLRLYSTTATPFHWPKSSPSVVNYTKQQGLSPYYFTLITYILPDIIPISSPTIIPPELPRDAT